MLFFPVAVHSLRWRQALNSGHTFLFLFISLALYHQLLQLSWYSMQQYMAMPLVTQLDKSWSKSFVKLQHVRLLITARSQSINWHHMQFDRGEISWLKYY